MSGFLRALTERVLVLDGAIGTSIQDTDLTPEDFGDLDGCNEILVRTRPDAIRAYHDEFLAVGCDAVETDTFGGAPWVLDDYGLGADTEDLNQRAAQIAREACDAAGRRPLGAGLHRAGHAQPHAVAGQGPGDRQGLPRLRRGRSRGTRGWRAGCWRAARTSSIVETVFDLLQAKAAMWACHEAMAAEGRGPCRSWPRSRSRPDLDTMLLGSEIGAAVVALTPLGIDVLGPELRDRPGGHARARALPVAALLAAADLRLSRTRASPRWSTAGRATRSRPSSWRPRTVRVRQRLRRVAGRGLLRHDARAPAPRSSRPCAA